MAPGTATVTSQPVSRPAVSQSASSQPAPSQPAASRPAAPRPLTSHVSAAASHLSDRELAKRYAFAGAAVTGVLVILWMTLPQLMNVPPALRNPMHAYLTIVVGTLTIFLVGLGVARVRALVHGAADAERV